MEKIYLQGPRYGLYGSGDVVLARRDELPDVREGEFYTIEDVIATEMGKCAKHKRLIINGCAGDYSKKTFKVTSECLDFV